MFLDILLTLFLVSLNGFFVAAEFAIVKVRASQLELKAQKGNRFAVLSKQIVAHLDSYLAATQLGITLASLGLGWIGEPVVSKIILDLMHLFGVAPNPELAHKIALPVAFAFITILHIVFGELTPKSLAIQRSEKTTLFVSYPLRFFHIVFTPFIWVLNGIANFILRSINIQPARGSDVHSSEELKYLVYQGQESGQIDEKEYKIIRNAFDFSEHTAKQVMVPRVNIFALDVSSFNDKALEDTIEAGYSRIPCYEGNKDNIIGLVYLKDILLELRKQGKPDLKQIMRPILVVPETKSIGTLLTEFQAKHQQMALVVNEYAGTEGIITMEDILEELVGEIQDESDNELPAVEKTGENTYIITASAMLDDINELLPRPLKKENDFETLAGYLMVKCGQIPGVKDKITADGYEFSVLKKHRSTILTVRAVDQAVKAGMSAESLDSL